MIIARPDQFNLQITPIGQRQIKPCLGWCAFVFHSIKVNILDQKERPDAHCLGPMLDRCIEIIRHIGQLHDLAQ